VSFDILFPQFFALSTVGTHGEGVAALLFVLGQILQVNFLATTLNVFNPFFAIFFQGEVVAAEDVELANVALNEEAP
jgi:hypothetical protein